MDVMALLLGQLVGCCLPHATALSIGNGGTANTAATRNASQRPPLVGSLNEYSKVSLVVRRTLTQETKQVWAG